MEAQELIGLIISMQARLDAIWAMYLSINSSIILLMIIIRRSFSVSEKAIGIGIYLVVMWLSYITIVNTMRVLRALYTDLGKLSVAPDQPGYEVVTELMEMFSSSTIWNHSALAPGVIITGIVVTIIIVIFEDRVTKNHVGLLS